MCMKKDCVGKKAKASTKKRSTTFASPKGVGFGKSSVKVKFGAKK